MTQQQAPYFTRPATETIEGGWTLRRTLDSVSVATDADDQRAVTVAVAYVGEELALDAVHVTIKDARTFKSTTKATPRRMRQGMTTEAEMVRESEAMMAYAEACVRNAVKDTPAAEWLRAAQI